MRSSITQARAVNSDTNIRMHTNATNKNTKLLYPQLSYLITGICFDVHNNLGRYSREKQYGDDLELKLIDIGLSYEREFVIKGTGNIIDFIIRKSIILELKTKDFVVKEDYYQVQRYLQALNIKLGLIVNFRSRYLKPLRVVLIETDVRKKFI